MTGLLTKLQTAAGRSWESMPVPVRDHFQLKISDFKSGNFDVNASYSGKCVVILFLVTNVNIINKGVLLHEPRGWYICLVSYGLV